MASQLWWKEIDQASNRWAMEAEETGVGDAWDIPCNEQQRYVEKLSDKLGKINQSRIQSMSKSLSRLNSVYEKERLQNLGETVESETGPILSTEGYHEDLERAPLIEGDYRSDGPVASGVHEVRSQIGQCCTHLLRNVYAALFRRTPQ